MLQRFKRFQTLGRHLLKLLELLNVGTSAIPAQVISLFQTGPIIGKVD